MQLSCIINNISSKLCLYKPSADFYLVSSRLLSKSILHITGLLVDERSGVGRKPQRIETVKFAEYRDDVLRPHVLRGINTKPADTQVYQQIHIVRNSVSDPASDALQVPQTNQPTVPYLYCVVIILYHAKHTRIHTQKS